jgi:two-component system chemotaxis response regulator CheB
MSGSEKIKVLVVDDSLLSREIIVKAISSDPEIEVIGKAADAFEARDIIIKSQPDVMTCDIQMPKMNGIQFIKRLIPQYPLPVVVVSTMSDAIFDALNAGAVEFVTKPNVNEKGETTQVFIKRLIKKIKIASKAKIKTVKVEKPSIIAQGIETESCKIVAIGASTGGTEAIYNIIKALPKTSPGIVIVQHIPPVFSKMFAERLDKQTDLIVKEAQTGDFIENGKVYIAPGGMHMTIKKLGDKCKIECIEGEKRNGHCPSVDVLFESVAKAAGNRAIGVILTGMGSDGAKGLLDMRKNGARTIGQDEASSVVYGMPKVAFEIGAVEKQVGLNKIPSEIIQFLKQEIS